jgi:hypothetical protein
MAPSQAPGSARVGAVAGRPVPTMATSQALADRSDYAIAARVVMAGLRHITKAADYRAPSRQAAFAVG